MKELPRRAVGAEGREPQAFVRARNERCLFRGHGPLLLQVDFVIRRVDEQREVVGDVVVADGNGGREALQREFDHFLR